MRRQKPPIEIVRRRIQRAEEDLQYLKGQEMLALGKLPTEASKVDLLKPAEVDVLLRCPAGRTKKLAKAGNIPYLVLPNGDVRIERADLDRFMAENKWGGGGMNRGA